MTKQVIILNTPPNAGKNTTADRICELTWAEHAQFKDYLYKCTSVLFNIDDCELIRLANDRVLKDAPHKDLTLSSTNFTKLCKITKTNRAFTTDSKWNVHISPREALIYVSEIIIKPTMGVEYFGKMAADNLGGGLTVFSDGGFQEELVPVAEEVGEENVLIVQFTRGDKLDFLGDSRNWLEPYGKIRLLKTTNNGTVDELANRIIGCLKETY